MDVPRSMSVHLFLSKRFFINIMAYEREGMVTITEHYSL
jgi:hypothetical protein